MLTSPDNNICLICKREGIYTDRHHLIPKKMHSRIKKRKDKCVDLWNRKDEMINLCRPCHSKIHKTGDEKVLAFHLNTLELLKEQPEIIRWVEGIKDKPVGFKPKK